MSSGDNFLYNQTHSIDVLNKNGNAEVKNVLIKISRFSQYLQIKLRDINDFSFNFTSSVDWSTFETMKSDQCLEICYEEFHTQLIELLKLTLRREMLLRVECNETTCKMIFYERSRIKSLIFLIIHFNLTNQKEIIDEMSLNITQLKEINHGVNSQISSLKNQINEQKVLLDTALTTNHHLEKRFFQDVKCIEETFMNNLMGIENIFSTKMDVMFRKHLKILKDVDILKRGSRFKETLYSQTLLDLDKTKGDNLKQFRLIEELRNEINTLSLNKNQKEKILGDQQHEIMTKMKEIDNLTSTLNELRRDNLEATKIIAQKDKTNDEIARDLVQANTMLVNFTNQNDFMCKEIDQLKKLVTAQEKTVEDQMGQLKYINKQFEEYKKMYNEEKLCQLRSDLFKAKDRLEELEKQNREAIKINTLLTKKLASGETFSNGNFMNSKS
nr:cilia- and flagella-associated protein 58-like [Onthophagus taurus]